LQSEWVAEGRSDKKRIYREYELPLLNSGSHWRDRTMALKKLKLVNNNNYYVF